MFLSRLLARLRHDDRGFSMVVTLGAIAMMLTSAAISVQVIDSDQPVARKDVNRKAAFAAAESGLQVYVHKLLGDNAYWAKCESPADALNTIWNKPGAPSYDKQPDGEDERDPRTWKALPDKSAFYTIESLPANGKAKCNAAAPEDTMIDDSTATFRVRITGQAATPDGKHRLGPKRSLIATFTRRSFLDYIYFTDIEGLDPALFASYYANGWTTKESPGRNPSGGAQRTIEEWGNDSCSIYAYAKDRYGVARVDQRFQGRASSNTGMYNEVTKKWQDLGVSTQVKCVEIQFADHDEIRGPMHTNDSPYLCGTPHFGRKPSESIEVSAPGPKTASWRSACSGSAPYANHEGESVKYPLAGTWRFNQPRLELPDTNSTLKAEAPPTYTFAGKTSIELKTTGITVTDRPDPSGGLRVQNLAYPPEGVIYIESRNEEGSRCPYGYQVSDPQDTIRDRTGCGVAWVKGTYNKDLTIAAEDDVRIEGHVIRSGTALLGLIAQNFIRVHHPVSNQATCNADGSVSNASGSISNLQIDSALLSLNHSVIVDNWSCGSSLGNLKINGAIAQKYRGPVATTSGSGYVKMYEYDDRLRVRSPPKFLDPVASSWRIQTYQEQAPAQ